MSVPTPHSLDSEYHSGFLSNVQGPQFLLSNGSRLLTGNMALSDGVLLGGVNPMAHYTQFLSHLSDPISHNYARNLLDDSWNPVEKNAINNDVRLYGGNGLSVTKTVTGMRFDYIGAPLPQTGASFFLGIKDSTGNGVVPTVPGWINFLSLGPISIVSTGVNSLTVTLNPSDIMHGSIGGKTENDHHNKLHKLEHLMGGGDQIIYAQDTEPTTTFPGMLWIDTDEAL